MVVRVSLSTSSPASVATRRTTTSGARVGRPRGSATSGSSRHLPYSEQDIARFRSRVDTAGPVLRPELGACHVWTGLVTRTGYGDIRMGGVSGNHRLAHRVAWEIERGPMPRGFHVAWTCGNRLCVRPEHLRVTREPWRRLSAEQVADVRRRVGAGETRNAVARSLGVDWSTVAAVVDVPPRRPRQTQQARRSRALARAGRSQ